MPGIESISLIDAMEKQLGLKLEPARLPMPVVAVDSVNEKPVDNVANVLEMLNVPPPPTEFEVADIKPTDPGFKGRD